MGRKSLYLLIAGVFVAYYIYIPLPDNVEEPGRIMWMNTYMKTFTHLATFIELLGLNHYMVIFGFFMSFDEVPPTSDENVTVTETQFNNIPVRVYVPKRKSEALRRGLFYIHGGGWCLGSAALRHYDLLSRWTAERLDAVVISTK
ncbi:arylacetamide deacetylase-like [Otolemur garnettii]|uniref:arylacetamide deacetylase-like n=1 Tax=Otolemur garnettii TaxID=30611 RepID=UPI000C7F0CE7|nr:arylacetamide deacetylase-like [Otolemur garnettii]